MSYRAPSSLWSPALLLSLLLTGCGSAESEAESVIRPVRYQQVFSTGGNRVRSFSGSARAGVESRLSFKVTGTVRQVPVAVGDSVEAGQLIAQLDPEDFRLQVQQAQASLTQARAQERSARADYLRARELYENNSISLSELDAARAASESAASSVRMYEQALELARLQLSYTSLTAPIDGAVAAVNVEVNENVQQGQAVVLLTSGSQLEVSVAVPGVLISQIREGSQVQVSLDALPDREFSAVVTEVGIAATGAGMTYPVRVRLRESDPDIRSGMAAEVAFLFESSDNRVIYLVAPAAVGEDRDGRFVYVAEPSEGDLAVVRRRPVEVGELVADGLEIFAGLEDGDRVITAGWSKIEDGMTVRLST